MIGLISWLKYIVLIILVFINHGKIYIEFWIFRFSLIHWIPFNYYILFNLNSIEINDDINLILNFYYFKNITSLNYIISFLFFFFSNDQFILLIARTNQKKRREKGDPSNCKVSNLTLFPPMSATHVTYQCKIEERVARHIPGIPHSPSTCTRSYTHTHARHAFSRPRASERATSWRNRNSQTTSKRCISAPAGVPWRHFIQTWSRPNTKIRTWPVYVVRYFLERTEWPSSGWVDGQVGNMTSKLVCVCDDNVFSSTWNCDIGFYTYIYIYMYKK